LKPGSVSASKIRAFDHDLPRVGSVALTLSVFALLYYFQRGQILLYGDAVAHINIARRVFDSQTPGLLQLGTVWLPLPHLLMIPFLVFDSLWQSGVGGSIVSMMAYTVGVVGIFCLVRGIVGADVRTASPARGAACVAALVYGANPNLLYLQTTAMTEPLYLALFVWALVYLSDFLQSQKQITTEGTEFHGGSVWKCAACVAAAELTRYDGWLLAVSIAIVIGVCLVLRWNDSAFRRTGLTFLLGVALVPALWIAYNAIVYRNLWEFANGPYSARAIEQQSGAVNPAEGHAFVAGSYFLKSAQLSVAPGTWGRLWVAALVAALAFSIVRRSFLVPLVLLATPILFYALSIAHGGVPLYIPSWWPFTWYNIRYGLQLLPLFAVSAGMLAALLSNVTAKQWLVSAAIAAVVAASYVLVWRAQPLCLTEALVNSQTRLALEDSVAKAIQRTPPRTRFLMFLGSHPGVFQQDAIPLRQVVNEGNHRPWKKPVDPEGLWERALADPSRYVDYVLAFEGDEVDRRVERKKLTLLSVIHTTRQPSARIYQCQPVNQSR
jgi:hypothetical protein